MTQDLPSHLSNDLVLAHLRNTHPELFQNLDPNLSLPQIVRMVGEELYAKTAVGIGAAQELVDLEEHPPNTELAREYMRGALARTHRALPHHHDGQYLYVVFAFPGNPSSVNAVSQVVGTSIRLLVAPVSQVERALERTYGLTGSGTRSGGGTAHTATLGQGSPRPNPNATATPYVSDGVPDADEDDVLARRFLEYALVEADRHGASDVHFMRSASGKLKIHFRIHGILQTLHEVQTMYERLRNEHRARGNTDELGNRVVGHIMVRANMDVADLTRPQDGGFGIQLRQDDPASIRRIRAAMVPTINGLTIALRLLPRSQDLIPLEQQGFAPDELETLLELIQRNTGMILVTGPTGSGKSTTLAGIIKELLEKGILNIMTAEQPVEYRFNGTISQTDLTKTPRFGFAETLRAMLRMDPDVVMIGEIRDEETAKTATQAANTGHLVLSTMHTNNATLAVTRLEAMGVPPYQTMDSLLAVLAQRLAPTLCPHCSIPTEPSRLHLRAYGYEYLLDEPEFANAQTRKRGPGCKQCNNTGYSGRVAIREMLVVTPRIKELILERAPHETLRREAVKEGLRPLIETALRLYLQGKISLEDAKRVGVDQ